MDYKIKIDAFEGPLDLLLHLIKQSNINIQDISIDVITKQYLDYINEMEKMDLNIASEYLSMAAELLEIKSASLLPKQNIEEEDYEINSKEQLINKLLEYEQYKNLSATFKELEEYRQEFYTREQSNLLEYKDKANLDYGISLNDLIKAMYNLLEQNEIRKPLNTKITNKEYSITKRCHEIKKILKEKKKINFLDLFETFSKNYIVVTFLSILSMCKNQEIDLEQDYNFKNIIIKEKGVN